MAIDSQNGFCTDGGLRQPYLTTKINHVLAVNSAFMIGKSAVMRDVFQMIDHAASSGTTVVITGETGTGKDLVARQIHQRSGRHELPFVVVDCAAVPRELMENELYGHEKGAFTGAHRKTLGKIEIADGGTVFFDDIDCMATDLQAKLLRVLQERNFERVGGTKTITTNARFIFATNRDLNAEMEKGDFREDLYYRINVFPIHVAPLRERHEDISLLVKYFLTKHGHQHGKNLRKISSKANDCLNRYSWPGNVREVENEMERVVSMASPDLSTLRTEMLSHNILMSTESPGDSHRNGLLSEAVESLEKRMLCDALKRYHANKSAAARFLGLSRRGINKKLDRYHMHDCECVGKR
jgi:Nif-specific regulatory protein